MNEIELAVDIPFLSIQLDFHHLDERPSRGVIRERTAKKVESCLAGNLDLVVEVGEREGKELVIDGDGLGGGLILVLSQDLENLRKELGSELGVAVVGGRSWGGHGPALGDVRC